MVSILEIKILRWSLVFIFMNTPKEIISQIITDENPITINDTNQENNNSEDDYTWDDNKQHTEQHFY